MRAAKKDIEVNATLATSVSLLMSTDTVKIKSANVSIDLHIPQTKTFSQPVVHCNPDYHQYDLDRQVLTYNTTENIC